MACLNPCFNGIWSASEKSDLLSRSWRVLILVLMEYGLRERDLQTSTTYSSPCLNPCFNGIWSARTAVEAEVDGIKRVLILVLMEYGLREGFLA